MSLVRSLVELSMRPSRIAFTLSGLLYHNILASPFFAVGLLSS
jgi:hypothetical protein